MKKLALLALLVWVRCAEAQYPVGACAISGCPGEGGGSGTVTSVAISGGTTGLTAPGGPITTSGTFTLGGILIPANGGLGASFAASTGFVLFTAGTASATTLTLASSQFANQGTTSTILHGNAAGNPSFGFIVNADITAGTIDVTTKVTGTLPSANGGTESTLFAVSGPATTKKTYAFPNASATVLTTNAAVTVAQGGTGVATFTAGIVTSPGTTTALTTVAAPTGAVVGTTDTQTLTNKTLTAPSMSTPTRTIGSGSAAVRVSGILYADATSTASSGTGSQSLASYSLPANSLGTNFQGVRIRYVVTTNASNDSRIVTLKFGSTTYATITAATALLNAKTVDCECVIMRIAASSQGGICRMWYDDGAAATNGYPVGQASLWTTSTEDETAAILIDGRTGINGLTADVTYKMLLVEALP